MPELPEVETMRRGILPIVGRRIKNLTRPRSILCPIQMSPGLATFRRRVTGAKIDSVDRLGKRVIVNLDTGDHIIFEPRMSGLVTLNDAPTKKHIRLVFELSGRPHIRLLFWNVRGLGVASLLDDAEMIERLGPHKLGPDALTLTGKILRERLGRSARPIKVALLDQKAIAGIGNLYASEILCRAGVHPQRSCSQLGPVQWCRIAQVTREVLDEAILHQGSTLSDGTYRNSNNEAGGYQNHHRVYQRTGEKCGRCGRAAVVKIVQA
ncbi:MAG: formamidopyrimidine-DNA glycosylase, partial [Pirellulales bacterium]|nr:formamidopyrimidine-DNA glycosylase [Pirellulales bacterium]